MYACHLAIDGSHRYYYMHFCVAKVAVIEHQIPKEQTFSFYFDFHPLSLPVSLPSFSSRSCNHNSANRQSMLRFVLACSL